MIFRVLGAVAVVGGSCPQASADGAPRAPLVSRPRAPLRLPGGRAGPFCRVPLDAPAPALSDGPMRALPAAVLLAATLAAADVPAPRPPDECTADGDCVITTFQSCCGGGCCPPAPYATARASLEARQRACANKDCAERPCTSKMACRPVGRPADFLAVCQARRCVAVPRQPLGLDECAGDGDCVLSRSPCCGGCCDTTQAMTRARLRERQQGCALKKCAAPDCSAVRCAQEELSATSMAVCRGRACAKVTAGPRPPPPPTPPPAFTCRSDAECTVVYPAPGPGAACRQSPCGCCPAVEPAAVHVEQAARVRLVGAGTPRPPKPGEPSFGLSQGNTQGARCGDCPPPRAGRAVCQVGQCTLAPAPSR